MKQEEHEVFSLQLEVQKAQAEYELLSKSMVRSYTLIMVDKLADIATIDRKMLTKMSQSYKLQKQKKIAFGLHCVGMFKDTRKKSQNSVSLSLKWRS